MIINQLNSSSVLSESTVTSKDILYNKIAYGPDGKIVGNAPIMYNSKADYEVGFSAGQLACICYGNDIYTAVPYGSNNIYYSNDLVTWTSVSTPSSCYSYCICHGNGKFIILKWNGNIAAYSEDGINWTQTTLPASTYWSSVCYGNGKFVAISGAVISISYASNIAAYSEDGITWTKTTLPASTYWSSVCYGNGKFVAVTYKSSNIAAYSEDGINWTQTTLPASTYWSSVCYGNGKFITTSYTGIAAYSEDGINWTQVDLPINTSNCTWSAVCYGKNKFVAFACSSGYGLNIAAYSEDGITWTQTTLPIYNSWSSVCYGNGKFVAIPWCQYNQYTRNNGKFIYSEDGINWNHFLYNKYYNLLDLNILDLTTKEGFRGRLKIIPKLSDWVVNTTMLGSTDNDCYWKSSCYGDGKFVVMSNNLVGYSEDGVVWKQVPINIEFYQGGSDSFVSICYAENKFVAIGPGYYKTNAVVMESLDGLKWKLLSTLDTRSYSICYGNGKYVAIATNTNILLYSEDCINWIQSTLPSSTSSIASVCYGNGKFAVVCNVNSKTSIIYSEDCINWSVSSLSANLPLKPICYGNGKFIALTFSDTTKAAVYSDDLINWTQVNLPSSSRWVSVCYGGGIYLATGYWTYTSSSTGNSVAVFDYMYSFDGIQWIRGTSQLPYTSNQSENFWWGNLSYGKYKFIVPNFRNKIACISGSKFEIEMLN